MAQRVAPGVGAIVLAMGIACAPKPMGPGLPQERDVSTPILLVTSGTPEACVVDYKQDEVTSYPDKFVIFDISNYCRNQQVVMVGNFRKSQDPSQTLNDCTRAMDPAEPDRIFANDNQSVRTATVPGRNSQGGPGLKKIRLRIRRNADLPPGGALSYYFDVCLNGPVSKDPRLIIQR